MARLLLSTDESIAHPLFGKNYSWIFGMLSPF